MRDPGRSSDRRGLYGSRLAAAHDRNQTDRPIEVTLVGQPDDYEDVPLTIPASGGIGMLAGPFGAAADGCIQGSLVVTQDGRTIARKDQPYGGRWEVADPAASPPASSAS